MYKNTRTLRMCLLSAGACAGAAIAPARTDAQELRYSITPTAEHVQWDDALGLENTILYGGRAGFVFGRRIELQGFYLTNEGSAKSIGTLYDRIGVSNPPPGNPTLDVQNYGANIVFNFTTGFLTPFIRGGGSVVRFTPQGGERFDQIGLQYGGGLRFGKPGGLRFNVFADDLRFRVDRTLLVALPGTGTPVAADVDANKLRSNIKYGVGLTVPLGGSAVYDDRPEFSLSNVSLPVEVFAGRMDFANATGLPRQNIAGARTGIDFGPLVSLRGFYWRGVNDDFDATQKLQSYGGEAQFNLNSGPGLAPFIVAGGGQLDFADGYRPGAGDSTFVTPKDRTALILGGGIRLPLGERLQLNVAARNYLMSRDGELENVSRAGQLRSNWNYSAGVGFALGGARPSRERDRVAERDAERRVRDTVYIDRQLRDGGMRERHMADTVRVERRIVINANGDTISFGSARPGRDGMVEMGDGYSSGRTMTIPIPTEGEIIIRFGPPRAPMAPGAMGGDMMRGRPMDVTFTPSGDARSDSTVRDLEQRLRARIDSLQNRTGQPAQQPMPGQPVVQPRTLTAEEITALVREELARDRSVRDAAAREAAVRESNRAVPPPTVVVPVTAGVATGVTTAQPMNFGQRFSGGSVYSGFTFAGGVQALVGARVDAGQLSPTVAGLRLVPELAFGFGSGGTSTYVAANAQYEFAGFTANSLGRVRPRVGLGVGLLNFSNRVGGRDGLDLVLTPSYGVALDLPALRNGRGFIGAPALLVEHQGIGLFDVNRLIVGLTWRR